MRAIWPTTLPTAPVALGEAVYYVKWLAAAGYLVAVAPPKPDGRKGRTTWRLVKNTGAKPPMILRIRVLFDPNLHAVTYTHQPRKVPA